MRRFLACTGLIIFFHLFTSAQSEHAGDLLLTVQPLVHLHLVDSLNHVLEQNQAAITSEVKTELEGVQYEIRYDQKNALSTFLSALGKIDIAQNPVAYARISGRLGHVLSVMGEQKLADDYFEKASHIIDPSWAPWVAFWTAQHQQQQGIIGSALNLYQNAIQGFSATGQLVPASQIAFTLGEMQSKLANWDQAEQYFLTASDLTRQMKDTRNLARINLALAWMYLEMGELVLASEYAHTGLTAASTNDPVLVARLELILAASEQQTLANSTSYTAAKNALERVPGYMPGMEAFFLEQAIVLERSNQPAAALLARKKYDMFRDSAWVMQQAAQADQLVTRFQSELQVKDKEGQIVQLQSSQRYSRIILTLLSVLTLALLALFIALYLRYSQKRRDHEVLVERNQIIEEQHRQIVEKNGELENLNERLISEIADREYLEHSQEQNAHYLASLSQEIRNPLQSIQGISGELLMAKELDSFHLELNKIRSATQDIVHYLNDLLDKARLESGKITFSSEAFEPEQTISEVFARFQELANRRAISLQLECHPDLETPLVGDAIRLTQILSNLLKIVFQQEELKAITLTLRTRAGEDADSRILDLDIASDGRVRDPELLREVLTDPLGAKGAKPGAYYNGHTGLLLSRRLVELQQGLLLLETQANATHIRIWLPYRTTRELQSAHNLAVDSSILAGKNILLAEDNRLNQWVVTKILEEKGATVTVCDDGVQAVDAFNKNQFDLVIMDLQMPELDGYRATQSIKKLATSKALNIPILAMTASAYVISSDKASLFSMDDYIGKPFDRQILLNKVLGLISRTVKA